MLCTKPLITDTCKVHRLASDMPKLSVEGDCYTLRRARSEPHLWYGIKKTGDNTGLPDTQTSSKCKGLVGEHSFQPFEGGLRSPDPPRSGEILHSSVTESGSKVIMLGNDWEPPSLIIMLENHMLLLVVQLHDFCFYLLGSCTAKVEKHSTLGGSNAHTQLLQDPESLGDRPDVLKKFLLRVNHSLKERIIRKPIAVFFAPFRTYLMRDENNE